MMMMMMMIIIIIINNNNYNNNNNNMEKLVHGMCGDLAKYYNNCKTCISGDIGIGKSKAHSKYKRVSVQIKYSN